MLSTYPDRPRSRSYSEWQQGPSYLTALGLSRSWFSTYLAIRLATRTFVVADTHWHVRTLRSTARHR